ncbi:MAG TPA: hypothetical protein VGR02_17490 [Thermoanaerobaculia bacterium]|nr:hypothetical protein [Thermoanaerobaculia bacterium]
MKLVLLSGAGGGLTAWAFTIIGGATFGLSIWAALPLSIILGAAAALVAVYVIIPADVTKTAKLIAFAVLCGFLWKPILDAGRLVIMQRLEASNAKTEARKDLAELKSAQPAAAPAKAHEAAGTAAELLRASDRIDNPQLITDASIQAADAVTAIAQNPNLDPTAATLALQDIKKAASESGNEHVAMLAAQHIAVIQRTTSSRRPLATPPPVRP